MISRINTTTLSLNQWMILLVLLRLRMLCSNLLRLHLPLLWNYLTVFNDITRLGLSEHHRYYMGSGLFSQSPRVLHQIVLNYVYLKTAQFLSSLLYHHCFRTKISVQNEGVWAMLTSAEGRGMSMLTDAD